VFPHMPRRTLSISRCTVGFLLVHSLVIIPPRGALPSITPALMRDGRPPLRHLRGIARRSPSPDPHLLGTVPEGGIAPATPAHGDAADRFSCTLDLLPWLKTRVALLWPRRRSSALRRSTSSWSSNGFVR